LIHYDLPKVRWPAALFFGRAATEERLGRTAGSPLLLSGWDNLSCFVAIAPPDYSRGFSSALRLSTPQRVSAALLYLQLYAVSLTLHYIVFPTAFFFLVDQPFAYYFSLVANR
jgi:hypothetical protein